MGLWKAHYGRVKFSEIILQGKYCTPLGRVPHTPNVPWQNIYTLRHIIREWLEKKDNKAHHSLPPISPMRTEVAALEKKQKKQTTTWTLKDTTFNIPLCQRGSGSIKFLITKIIKSMGSKNAQETYPAYGRSPSPPATYENPTDSWLDWDLWRLEAKSTLKLIVMRSVAGLHYSDERGNCHFRILLPWRSVLGLK